VRLRDILAHQARGQSAIEAVDARVNDIKATLLESYKHGIEQGKKEGKEAEEATKRRTATRAPAQIGGEGDTKRNALKQFQPLHVQNTRSGVGCPARPA
jgi:hypothetical protein